MDMAMDDSGRGILPGIVLGLGLGGFLDGIALHQIAQRHNMGSAVVPPVTLHATGPFHVATWLLVTVGVYLFLHDTRRKRSLPTPRTFAADLVLARQRA